MITSRDLRFPGNIQDDSTITFIKKLLKKKVTERLCNLDLIKQEKFYEDFNFVI